MVFDNTYWKNGTGCPKTSGHFIISLNYTQIDVRLQSLAKTSSVYPNI